MLLPMGILAAGCLAIGLFPTFTTGLLNKCAESFTQHSALSLQESIAAAEFALDSKSEEIGTASPPADLVAFGNQAIAARTQIGEAFRWLVVISPVLAISLIGGLALLQWRLSLGKVGWSGT